jgi:SAM-dependent methyltransferase
VYEAQPSEVGENRMKPTISQLGLPSKELIRFAPEMSSGSRLPVLDAGCGFGRNAVALAARGMSVICVDRQFQRLKTLVKFGPKHLETQKQPNRTPGKLLPLLAELDPVRWPFRESCFSGIVCVHFVNVNLFELFCSSLISGGYLYFETFGGHGGNYLDLPRAGQLHDRLSKTFQLNFYQERKVGPIGYDAVTVKLFARKHGSALAPEGH